MEKKQTIVAFIFLVLGAASLIRTTFILWNSYLPDFSTRYDSTVLILKNKNPYINTNSFTSENYPPSALMLQLPFSLFSFPVASKIWLLISIFSFFISVALLYKIFPISFFRVAILFLLSVIAFPFKFTLGMGQVNLMLLFLLVLSLYSLLKNKDNLFAIFISIATALKLFPIFLILTLIFKKRYKEFLVAMILVLFLFFLPSLLQKSSINDYYFRKIFFPLLFNPAGDVYYNQSITGFFARLNFPFFLLTIARFVLIIYSLVIAYRKRANLFLVFSILLTVLILTNNFTWQHHLILLIIPYYFILKQKISKPLFFLTAFSYFLVAVNIKNPQFFSSAWYGSICLSHAFFGVFLLWVILAWNLKYD